MPGARQILDVSGTEFPADLVYDTHNGHVRIKLAQDGATVDSEEYIESQLAFSLVEAEDTTYNPVLPLLKFPMNYGDTWSWKGTATSSGRSIPSSAQVTVGKEDLKIGNTFHNAVKIDVSLKLEGRASMTPSTRHLVFWFEPGMGLLKRDFGGLSIRRPAE